MKLENFVTLRDVLDNFRNEYQAGAFSDSDANLTKISLDMSLFIRLLEYSREDIEDDVEIHQIAENAERLCDEVDILTMKHYDQLIGR